MAIRFDDDDFEELLKRHRRDFSCEPRLAESVRRRASLDPPTGRLRLAWETFDARCETMAGSVLFAVCLMAATALLGAALGERSKSAWLAEREGERMRQEQRLEASYLARIDPMLRARLWEVSGR